jgi:ribose 5-phosphate isomerase B
MCSSISEIEQYAIINQKAKRIIQAFLPGELTIILKTKGGMPMWVDLGTGNIGIRVPDDENVIKMIKLVGKPLLVPSANRADQAPMTTDTEVIGEFENDIDGIVLGKSKGATPSTVVAAYDKINVLREGNLSLSDIKRAAGEQYMRIVVASDHGGFEYKNEIRRHLERRGFQVFDVGTFSNESVNYPDYAAAAAKKIANGEADRGILVCTSGEGVMIAANKVKGVRAGIGYNDTVSRLLREHNDANVITFGQKFMELEDVIRRIDIFLETPFEGGRHANRVEIIKNIEKDKQSDK